MTADGNDAAFCREHAFAGNPLFRVSVILAPDDRRELTALYALFDVLLRVAPTSQEEGVVRSRLEWWRHECLVRDPRESAHPALRELLHGARQIAFDRPAFAALIDQVEARLETPAVGDLGEFLALCERVGRPLVDLERSVAAPSSPAPDVDHAVAQRRGLWVLLADVFLRGDPAGAWWLPLDHLAREALPRGEVFAAERRDATARVFAELLQAVASEASMNTDISKSNQSLAHIQLMDYLTGSKCRRLGRATPSEYGREMSRVRVGEFLGAWKRARRFSRPR